MSFEEAIITPEAFCKATGRTESLATHRVLVLLQGFLWAWARENLEVQYLSGQGLLHSMAKSSPVLIHSLEGFGAASTIAQLEQLHFRGAKEIILLGTAASLSADLDFGDFVAVKSAFRGEGTSAYYGATDESISSAPNLMDVWSGRQVVTWSTDAPFRETMTWIEQCQTKGAECIDMEASAVLTWSHFRKIKLLSTLVISDRILAGAWQPGLRSPRTKEGLKSALKQALRLFENFPKEAVGEIQKARVSSEMSTK